MTFFPPSQATIKRDSIDAVGAQQTSSVGEDVFQDHRKDDPVIGRKG